MCVCVRACVLQSTNTFYKSNLISKRQPGKSGNGFDKDDKSFYAGLDVWNETALQQFTTSVNVNARGAEYCVVLIACQWLHWTKHLLLQRLLLLQTAFTMMQVGETK